ncbi:hypothetical protein FNV43_RR25919 [Rhamnella rubrinervis]|uniref:Uncharacterized protein n=1 Tax=Rhamnella rubrinervis TaxID=2594499 RepID=A0A8K0DN26_9ROSA|nr:hypothetical protein FNV43_RR25919 [Rhamnella rubrinervis]
MYRGTSSPCQPRGFDSSDSFNDQQQTVTVSELFAGAVHPKPHRHRHNHVSFISTDSSIEERHDQAPIRAFEQHEPHFRGIKFRVHGENVDAEADEFIKLEHQKFLASKTLSSFSG